MAGKPASKKVKSPRKAKRVKCIECGKALPPSQRAIFVEEEVGRVFCGEQCIVKHFQPQISGLEKEFVEASRGDDLTGDERASLSGLRWRTLSEPQEIWQMRTTSQDLLYTLISEYYWENRKVWNICLTLMLRGEPSFLFLAFTTSSLDVAEMYRRGDRVQRITAKTPTNTPTDKLGDPWTEDEMLRARLSGRRRRDDIPKEDFMHYQYRFDDTLQSPDEVWSIHMGSHGGAKLFHFIKRFEEEKQNYWYIVVARETEDPEQIEVMEVFPTRDEAYVQQYRCGVQEMGIGEASEPASRLVH
jgi:hypothetical protein